MEDLREIDKRMATLRKEHEERQRDFDAQLRELDVRLDERLRKIDARYGIGEARARDPWLIPVFTMCVVAFFLAVFCAWRTSVVRGDCYRFGYQGARITWGGLGEAYCVKRVDQTDVIVPLDDLGNGDGR